MRHFVIFTHAWAFKHNSSIHEGNHEKTNTSQTSLSDCCTRRGAGAPNPDYARNQSLIMIQNSTDFSVASRLLLWSSMSNSRFLSHKIIRLVISILHSFCILNSIIGVLIWLKICPSLAVQLSALPYEHCPNLDGSVLISVASVLIMTAPKNWRVRYPSETVLWYLHMKSGHYSISRAFIPSL